MVITGFVVGPPGKVMFVMRKRSFNALYVGESVSICLAANEFVSHQIMDPELYSHIG